MTKRVAVTGLGVVSSIGIGKEEFWKNLAAGKSGISKITLFDTSKFKRHYAGQIKNFEPSKYISENILQFLPRASKFALVAARLGLDDAGIDSEELKDREMAVIIGTTMPEASMYDISSRMLVSKKWDKMSSKLLLNVFSPSTPRNIGHFLRTKYVNLLIPNACAAGNYAIGYGFDLLQREKIDFAIVGGAEALSRVAFQGFQRLYAMSPRLCSPFDKNRKGMLLGEGAGILILEPLDKALQRNAPIYAEVLGSGLSCDAFNITIPHRRGIRKAMEKALKNSNVSTNDIDYINAHGTGTTQNDKEEVGAIKELFGQRYKKIPVSSIKSMLGHTMGAASAIEAIVCCLALKEQLIPPTINFKTPDPECDIDCVPNTARKANLKTVLNNAFAFGGNNCCVVFAKADSYNRGKLDENLK